MASLSVTIIMKNLLSIFGLCLAAVTASAQYANTNGAISGTLPSSINWGDSVTMGPSWDMMAQIGWRVITNTQTSNPGWVVTSYNVVDSGNGSNCYLTIATQYNMQAMQDAALTNSVWWTREFITNCQTFRAVLISFGTTETQAVVNASTMSTWVSAYAKTNTITPLLTGQLMFMSGMFPQILQFGATNTSLFPWRLIP